MNNTSGHDTYVLIMAGGDSSCFRSKSRNNFLKQFIDILGIVKSLLQLTYERFLKIYPGENIFILSNEQYSGLIKEQLTELPEPNIISEPSRNNIAPCIRYASFKIRQINGEANIVVAPSDHLILNEVVFLEKIKQALAYINKDALVTLGITPTRPDTGYGYINYRKKENEDAYQAIKFLEKPDLERAKGFLASADYLWNAEIFVWKVNTILAAPAKYSPELYELFEKGSLCYNTSDERSFISENYPSSANISIDYAIMEKAENVYTIPGEFGWSDLGTWASLYEVAEKDEYNNVVAGRAISLSETTNCIIQIQKTK